MSNTSTKLLPFYQHTVMGQIHYPAHDHIAGKPSEPWLSVSGDWLREAGFKGGQKLTIQYGWQKLVIAPSDDET